MNATTLLLFLLLLACPLGMLFMHRGGGHSHGSHDAPQNRATDSDAAPLAGQAPQSQSGCGHPGHGGGSRHDHTKGGTAA